MMEYYQRELVIIVPLEKDKILMSQKYKINPKLTKTK